MRRLVTLTAATAAVVAALAAPAAAEPGNGTGQSTFPIRCGAHVVHLTISNGTWSAAYVQESGNRFIPKATYVSVVDASTGELLFEEIDEKPNGVRQSNISCVDEVPSEGLIVTFRVSGRLT